MFKNSTMKVESTNVKNMQVCPPFGNTMLGEVPVLMSFSGGRSSALTLKMVTQNGIPNNMIILFANTGKENIETLEFVYKCQTEWNLPIIWIEADFIPFKEGMSQREQITFKVVDFETASKNGEPFKEMIMRFGVPNGRYRFCTEYLKLIPMKKYLESIGIDDYDTILGIRYDEPIRVAKHSDCILPLNKAKITHQMVRIWWAKNDFDLKLKDYQGNCDFCILKGINKRKTIAFENPEKTKWWSEMEELKGSTFELGKSVKQIVIEANKKFKHSKDEYEKRINSPELFKNEEFEISCFCGD